MDKKIKGVKLYEQAVENIKDSIMKGEYVKGDLLPSENEMVQSMGVSRITVREALKILVEVGIIEKKRGKGSIVLLDAKDLILDPEMDKKHREFRKSFKNSTETRIMLEPEIARQVALFARDEDIIRLEKCLNDSIEKMDNKKRNYDENLLEGFHWCMIDILDNQILRDIFKKLFELESWQMQGMLIPPSHQETVVEKLKIQHRKIFESIKEHNGEFAYFYMKEHSVYVRDMYENYFDSFFED